MSLAAYNIILKTVFQNPKGSKMNAKKTLSLIFLGLLIVSCSSGKSVQSSDSSGTTTDSPNSSQEIKVIDIDPKTLMPEIEQIPGPFHYYIDTEFDGNYLIVDLDDPDILYFPGYLENVKPVIGFDRSYKRIEQEPSEYEPYLWITIVLYEDKESAEYVISNFDECYGAGSGGPDYKIVSLSINDKTTVACQWSSFAYDGIYEISFAHRNIGVELDMADSQGSIDYLVEIAEKIDELLSQKETSSFVTISYEDIFGQ